MNKQSLREDMSAQKNARVHGSPVSLGARLGLAAALCGALAVSMSDVPSAQQRSKEQPVRVTGVATSGNTVSISADGSLNRAQTWQDPEGFHVVLPNGQASDSASRGVKVRHVGNSLELVIPVRQGANVTVEPRGSQLNLVVSGGTARALNVENFPGEANHESAPREQTGRTHVQETQSVEQREQQPASKRRSASGEVQSNSQQSAPQPSSKSAAQSAPQPAPQEQPSAPAASVANSEAKAQPAAVGNSESVTAAQLNSAQLQTPQSSKTDGGFDFFSFAFSMPVLLTLLGVGLTGAALFFLRRGRMKSEDEFEDEEFEKKGSKASARAGEEPRRAVDVSSKPFEQYKGDRRKASMAVPFERRKGGRGAEDEALRQLAAQDAGGAGRNGQQPDVRVSVATAQAVQFGAFRIDQEVSRLVEGKPHSTEVLSSRAQDDRRAVETSLLKSLRAPETDEEGRRRARMALEDYGFVARSCAALLLGAEGFERAYAARTLGEMKSAHALPFLSEALYDTDSVVRLECVQSLGALGLPSAIGALLDVASRHRDIPASVIGPALTACSVESMELNWDSQLGGRTFADAGETDWFEGDVRMLAPVENFEELPEWVEDERLQAALGRLESADVEARVNSAQQLAQFQVRRSVEALALLSQNDSEPSVRSAAVTSLGLIDHESVFAPVIVALADEAREVRAAAARALSRLSFDRAEAYVRVIESADERTLRGVARACSKAGLTAQAINRLASEDRRQAYEAFSLLSLCVKAGEVQPILDTIECHREIEVRLACVGLLATFYHQEVGERLLRIAENGGVPEKVRQAIHEMVGHAAEPQLVAAE